MNKTLLRVCALAALTMLVLGGCFKVDVDITVEQDGSGQAVFITAIDYETIIDMASAMGDAEGAAPEDGFSLMPTTKEEICGDTGLSMDGVPENAELDEYDEGGFCGIKATVEFANADELAELLEMFSESGDGTTSSVDITQDGDEWLFEASIETEADGSLLGEDAAGIPIDSLFDSAQFQFHVQLPGEAIEHNADEVDGSRFTWNLDPMQPSQSMMARTGPDAGGTSVVVVVAAVLLVAAAAAGGFWLMRRGRDL